MERITEPRETRREIRFGIETDQINVIKAALGKVFQEQPHSGQVVQTIYYATREFGFPNGGFVRERRYLSQDDTATTPLGALEIKFDEAGCVTKTRSRDFQDVGNTLANLGKIGDLEKLFELGLDREMVLKVVGDIGLNPLLPLVETICQRHYYIQGGQRVTLDINEHKWGYFGEQREERVLLDGETCGRLEIKAPNESELNQAWETVNSSGVRLLASENRKKEFQHLYLTKMEELNQRRSVSEFTNEVPGNEVEAKLQIINVDQPLSITDRLFSDILEGRVPSFAGMTGKEVLKEWEFRFINYGYKRDGKLEEALVVVIDPNTDSFAVKKKGNPTTTEGPALIRSENVYKYLGPFSDETEVGIINEEQEKTGLELIRVGEVARRKRYTYISNKVTGRNYKVGADICRSSGCQMSQFEIEYMGRTGKVLTTDCTVREIMGEIGAIKSFLFERYKDVLVPTNLTKFQWLVSLSQ